MKVARFIMWGLGLLWLVVGIGLCIIIPMQKDNLVTYFFKSGRATISTIKEPQFNSSYSIAQNAANNETKVYVSYWVAGKLYSNVEYPSYEEGMKVGDEVEVYYMENEPGTIFNRELANIVCLVYYYVFIGVGIFEIVLAIIALILGFVFNSKYKRRLRYGY